MLGNDNVGETTNNNIVGEIGPGHNLPARFREAWFIKHTPAQYQRDFHSLYFFLSMDGAGDDYQGFKTSLGP